MFDCRCRHISSPQASTMSSRRSGRKDAPSTASASAGKKAKTEAAATSAIAPPVNAIKKGTDSEGKEYKDLNDLWKAEFEDPDAPAADAAAASSAAVSGAPVKKSLAWYQKGAGYWASQAASVDGVLGGFGHVSPVDIQGSKAFLASIPGGVRYGSAIDCGAGIGRISKGLLAPLFKAVDLVEQDPKYVAKAREEYCKDLPSMRDFIVEGLQSFAFPRGSYDCIWIQWVIGHLPDRDFVPFMQRAVAALAPGGVICLKENIAKKGFVMDLDDQSVTRTDAQYRELFEKANLELVATELQKNFPSVLFPVRMYALRPKAPVAAPAAAHGAAPVAASSAAAATPAAMES